MTVVLLTGADGQLASEIAALAPDDVELVALGRAQLDIADAKGVDAAIARIAPQFVINAAAYNAVDAAEHDRAAATAINATGPGNLARAAAGRGAWMVHFSTDYVFDGARRRPYTPADATGPLNFYGETKLRGEQEVARENGARAIVVRTSWLYSSRPRNFVSMILDRLERGESLKIVDDQTGAPTWARGLARVTWAFVRAPRAGVFHWCDAGQTTRYGLACAAKEEAVAAGRLAPRGELRPVSSAEFAAPARRPPYSVMDASDTTAATGIAQLAWRDALRRMLRGEEYGT